MSVSAKLHLIKFTAVKFTAVKFGRKIEFAIVKASSAADLFVMSKSRQHQHLHNVVNDSVN